MSFAPPIQLFHPAFREFLEGIRCTSGNIDEDVIRATAQYMQAASASYATEQRRRTRLNPILEGILKVRMPVIENNDKTKADGTVEGIQNGNVFLLLVKEDKNEFGDGGSDPSIQVGLSAARSWVQPDVRDFHFSFIRKAHSSIPQVESF